MCMDDDGDTAQTDHHGDDGCYDDGSDVPTPTIGTKDIYLGSIMATKNLATVYSDSLLREDLLPPSTMTNDQPVREPSSDAFVTPQLKIHDVYVSDFVMDDDGAVGRPPMASGGMKMVSDEMEILEKMESMNLNRMKIMERVPSVMITPDSTAPMIGARRIPTSLDFQRPSRGHPTSPAIQDNFSDDTNIPTPHRTEHVGDYFGNRVEDNVAMGMKATDGILNQDHRDTFLVDDGHADKTIAHVVLMDPTFMQPP